jgi:hypothetical protein
VLQYEPMRSTGSRWVCTIMASGRSAVTAARFARRRRRWWGRRGRSRGSRDADGRGCCSHFSAIHGNLATPRFAGNDATPRSERTRSRNAHQPLTCGAPGLRRARAPRGSTW